LEGGGVTIVKEDSFVMCCPVLSCLVSWLEMPCLVLFLLFFMRQVHSLAFGLVSMVKSSSQPPPTGVVDAEHANPSTGGRNLLRSQTTTDPHRILVHPISGPDDTIPRFPGPPSEGE
jgi:hypothetical protein